MSEITDTIIEIRKKTGKSQADFAELIGVSRVTLGNWEAGRQVPPLDKFIDMANLAGQNAMQTINALTNG
ncbi:MAG: Antitoxin component of bacterial toxin-antitoxin system, MqsA, partial [Pseudomonadota bacterium]